MKGGQKENNQEQDKNENKLQFEMRIYSTPYKNSKNKNIGKISHHLQGTLPYNSTDQVDHFLYNMYNYVTAESIRNSEFAQKKLDEEGNEFIDEFYPHFKKTIDLYPMSQDLVTPGKANKNAITATVDDKKVYLHRKTGGKKIKKTRRSKKKHNKTIKSKK